MVVAARTDMPSPTLRKVSFSARRRSLVSRTRSDTAPKKDVTGAARGEAGHHLGLPAGSNLDAAVLAVGITRSLKVVAAEAAPARSATGLLRIRVNTSGRDEAETGYRPRPRRGCARRKEGRGPAEVGIDRRLDVGTALSSRALAEVMASAIRK